MSWMVTVSVLLALSAYFFNRRYSTRLRHQTALPSTPFYYGSYAALLIILPNILLLLLWLLFGNSFANLLLKLDEASPYVLIQIDQYLSGVDNGLDPNTLALAEQKANLIHVIDNIVMVLVGLISISGAAWAYLQIIKHKPVHKTVENIVRTMLLAASIISVLTTVGIVFSLLFESIRFFNLIPIHQFLFGLEWQPQTAIRQDQVGSTGAFGFLPVFVGTLLISVIAMAVSLPIGIFSAIYMSEYANKKVRTITKPILEILAGVPTVVYGFFAVLVIAPQIRSWGEQLGLSVSSESALAAGLVMGIMLIPFISSLSDDIISAVPMSLREGSYGLGATQAETIKKVVLPAAMPGIASAALLAFSRAIGETMIVVMAAGLAANLSINPLEAVTTITVQIVTLLVGDQEFESAKTLAAFALGLTLFLITLILNVIALYLVNRYREQYD